MFCLRNPLEDSFRKPVLTIKALRVPRMLCLSANEQRKRDEVTASKGEGNALLGPGFMV